VHDLAQFQPLDIQIQPVVQFMLSLFNRSDDQFIDAALLSDKRAAMLTKLRRTRKILTLHLRLKHCVSLGKFSRQVRHSKCFAYNTWINMRSIYCYIEGLGCSNMDSGVITTQIFTTRSNKQRCLTNLERTPLGSSLCMEIPCLVSLSSGR